jgi:formate hydrogenlyase subunit 3/multisubunit Na+/H+ antiporter MnhD subunit
MMALVQHYLRRLLSYHAVSQVGYMILGIGTGVPVAVAGGIFHLLNNVLYKSCLFLGAGAVEQKTGTSDLDSLGGLAKAMPVTFVATAIAAFSISGIPPFNGFTSKWMIYQGLVESGKHGGWLWIVCLAAAMLGSALTLASFVKLLHSVFLRKSAPEVAALTPREAGVSMWFPMAVLATACIVFGVAAYRLPLKHLVFPAVGVPVVFSGIWWAAPATVMLAVAILAGLVIYLMGTVMKARTAETYIGGEYMDRTYVSGEKTGSARDVEVTGVDFYGTVKDMAPMKQMYAMAEKKLFDIYDVGGAIVFGVSKVVRLFHTGVLRSYVVWVAIGIVILLFAM